MLAILVPSVHAQVPQPSVTLDLDATTLDVGAANSTSFNGTVTFNDQVPGSTGNILVAATAPDGWTVSVTPSTLTLAAGASGTFVVTVNAPAAATGAATGNVDITTTSANDQAGRSATATQSVAVTRVDPLPPPPVPWWQTPIGIAGIVGAILLVAAIIGYVVYRNKQQKLAAERAAAAAAAAKAAYLDRETGITIALAGDPIQYGHKREIVYRLAVKNTSGRPRVAIADVAEATNGWRASLQFSKIPLSPGQTMQLTLVVTPDAVITPGDRATVIVRAKPEEAQELSEKLTIDVVAPKHGVPADPHYRIVTVHREGANVGVNR